MRQAAEGFAEGDLVFVPGANCYKDVRGLFGGAAKRIVLPAARAVKLDGIADEEGILIALAATAHHAVAGEGAALPQLIVGHGVLGRLHRAHHARPRRRRADRHRNPGRAPRWRGGYTVLTPEQDTRRDYATICDASGAAGLLDTLIPKLAKRGEITLAGFYEDAAVLHLPARLHARGADPHRSGIHHGGHAGREDAGGRSVALSLSGLISHHAAASTAAEAYEQAFTDPNCIKMALDWSALA